MVLHVLRTLFVLLMGAVGWYYLQDNTQFLGRYTWLVMAIALSIGVFTVCVDILSPRKKLAIFSGTLFGLVVGLFITYALTFIVRLIVEQFAPATLTFTHRDRETAIEFVNVLVGVTICYLTISFVLQTKDDFRFIIPYVEFAKQTRGARPMLLDTSVLIDGRIADIAATGIVESQLVVPRFVLDELQQIADSSDRLKRNRGRRGLDVLARLQANKRLDVVLYEGSARDEHAQPTLPQSPAAVAPTAPGPAGGDVDSRLLLLGKELSARVLTNDFNLNKIAQLRGVDVININQLALALKPTVLPGERLSVRLVKSGDQAGQGIGYLDDGTMVVVEHGRQHINQDVEFTVTSSLQNNTGKMIFGRLVPADGHSPAPSPQATPSTTAAPPSPTAVISSPPTPAPPPPAASPPAPAAPQSRPTAPQKRSRSA